MPKFTAVLIAVFMFSVPWRLKTQEAQPPKKERPWRSPFLLLPNYKLDVKGGFEGNYHGTISKPAGLSIEYEVDIDAPRAADAIEPNQIGWRLSQTLKDRSFDCVYTKSDEFVITSPSAPTANFRAKIRTHQDLAEMLFTVLTFEPQRGYPIDPKGINVTVPRLN